MFPKLIFQKVLTKGPIILYKKNGKSIYQYSKTGKNLKIPPLSKIKKKNFGKSFTSGPKRGLKNEKSPNDRHWKKEHY